MPARRLRSNSMLRRALAGRAGDEKKVLVSGFLVRRQRGKEFGSAVHGSKATARKCATRKRSKQDWLGVDSESDDRRDASLQARGPSLLDRIPQRSAGAPAGGSRRLGEVSRCGRAHCRPRSRVAPQIDHAASCSPSTCNVAVATERRGDFSPACHSRRPRRALTLP